MMSDYNYRKDLDPYNLDEKSKRYHYSDLINLNTQTNEKYIKRTGMISTKGSDGTLVFNKV